MSMHLHMNRAIVLKGGKHVLADCRELELDIPKLHFFIQEMKQKHLAVNWPGVLKQNRLCVYTKCMVCGTGAFF